MKTYLLYPLAALFVFAATKTTATVRYVNASNASPSSPYLTWGDAASTIQDAVDISVDNDEIVVTNGVYATGGRVVYGAMSNRVAITKSLIVRSVNGPAVTFIQGYQVPGTTNGIGAVRCVYLTNGAALSGFTLTHGATLLTNSLLAERSGGGVWCESDSATVSNCVLTGNSASWVGGGAYQATLNNCSLSGNAAGYGGGGTYQSWLNDCVISGNTAPNRGGGVYSSTLNNCLVSSNSASYGGGAYYSTLNNCTAHNNSASLNGGGVYQGALNNSIVCFNSAPDGDSSGGFLTANHSCTTPLPAGGIGNFTNAPLFVNQNAGNLHLQSTSPCINSGDNAAAPTLPDLDGHPRIVGGTVDVGAYEFQTPTSLISYLWLQQYGLPLNGSADFIDSDGDGMNNWQEWIAGTIPTDPLSVLKMSAPAGNPAGFTLTWQSVGGKNYYVQRTGSLLAPFSTIQSNIVGLPGTTSYTDTNTTGSASLFYRVGVQ